MEQLASKYEGQGRSTSNYNTTVTGVPLHRPMHTMQSEPAHMTLL